MGYWTWSTRSVQALLHASAHQTGVLEPPREFHAYTLQLDGEVNAASAATVSTAPLPKVCRCRLVVRQSMRTREVGDVRSCNPACSKNGRRRVRPRSLTRCCLTSA